MCRNQLNNNVMLKFSSSWRYDSPGAIPVQVYSDFLEIIGKIARGEQKILEHFKRHFASASGVTSSWSSNASWADTDLQNYMDQASGNAPLFIEAFWDACEELREDKDSAAPDLQLINRILARHQTRFKIEPPNLLIVGNNQAETALPEIPHSLDQSAQDTIQASFNEAQKLLAEGRDRQAVQELLWLLETVSTAFQGLNNGQNSSIEGKYFNKIIEELRKSNKGTALDQIISWIKTLHGYLSAPAGGGVRHGMHLREGVAVSPGEAKLYCNLITSYISFLLSEYERLKQ